MSERANREMLDVAASDYIAMSEFDHAALAAEIRTAMSETQD